MPAGLARAGRPVDGAARGTSAAGPTAVNVVALVWIAFITVLFVLPPNQLAGYTFAGALAVLAVYWYGWMNKRFRGPRVAAE